MNSALRTTLMFSAVAAALALIGVAQSWNIALTILNMGLISAIMALGVNLQWGFAGLFNVGVMGFVALGGLAAVLIGQPPVSEAWAAGGPRIIAALIWAALVVAALVWVRLKMAPSWSRAGLTAALIAVGFVTYRALMLPAIASVEAVDPAVTGYLGGLGLPILLAWPFGAVLAAGAAWMVGKTALGLRADYLAIATLGISEIIIALLRNESWLARGVKNVIGLPRPVPYEIDLQNDPEFVARAGSLGLDATTASTLTVKVSYLGLIAFVLVVVLVLAQLALHSPWGRMIRAIRDNEVSAQAMGKNIKARHLQIFVLGSAICGLAGAMMTTLDGQLTPSSYQPLRFTFLIWVMVIVGGSGNNFGAVLGGVLVWMVWVQVEPLGLSLATLIGSGLPEDSALADRLIDASAHMRFIVMGALMLLVLRFAPKGLLPAR